MTRYGIKVFKSNLVHNGQFFTAPDLPDPNANEFFDVITHPKLDVVLRRRLINNPFTGHSAYYWEPVNRDQVPPPIHRAPSVPAAINKINNVVEFDWITVSRRLFAFSVFSLYIVVMFEYYVMPFI